MEMTWDELAEKVVRDWQMNRLLLSSVDTTALAVMIRDAFIKESNVEVERRRKLERQLEGLQAGGPVIVCTPERTQLRVWNKHRQSWFEFDGIEVGKQKSGANC